MTEHRKREITTYYVKGYESPSPRPPKWAERILASLHEGEQLTEKEVQTWPYEVRRAVIDGLRRRGLHLDQNRRVARRILCS